MCDCVYSSVLKQTKVGRHVKPLELASFENKRLCIVLHLKENLCRTKDLRVGKELFISFVKPHRHVSRDTISRWIKEVLNMAGIDTTKFSAHSTWSASMSAAFDRDVPLDILQAAGWSSKKTFSKLYCRPVLATHTKTVKSLVQSVLDKFVRKKY